MKTMFAILHKGGPEGLFLLDERKQMNIILKTSAVSNTPDSNVGESMTGYSAKLGQSSNPGYGIFSHRAKLTMNCSLNSAQLKSFKHERGDQ
jgi:hypothetical protein